MRPGNIEHCFEWIKTEQFKEAFEKSILYKKLSELEIDGCSFNINLDALAQHYGFKTSYLDLTQNRLVAQFFAYTDYDQNKKEFFQVKFEIQAKDINEIANYLDNITIPFIMNNIGHLGRLQLPPNF